MANKFQPIAKLLCRGGVLFRLYNTVPLPKRPNEKRESLVNRIVSYFDTEYHKKFEISKTHNPQHFNDEELNEILTNLKDRKLFSSGPEFRKVLTLVDRECTSRLDYLDSGTILSVLNVLIGVDKIEGYKFYRFGLNNLIRNVEFLNRNELLQTIFYLGLQKKNPTTQKQLKKCISEFYKYDIEGLSIEELCVICNSSFRTSTKITSKRIIGKIHKTIRDNLVVLNDPALFVTLIKTLRHNREQTDDTLSTIACAIVFNKTYRFYSFMAVCHILALFADYAYYDEELLEILVSTCLKELKTLSNDIHSIRSKDITRLLWALSVLNYSENPSVIDVILPIIEKKVKAGDYRKDMEDLMDTVLYLWMLNCEPIEIVEYALTGRNINYIKGLKSRSKQRLNLLQSCVAIENPKLFERLNLTSEPFRPIHTNLHLERRPNLDRVLRILNKLPGDLNFAISYEVPHLDICGITGYNRSDGAKAIYVEVLDSTVCVKNRESWPIGPMFLKLRLLKSFNEGLVIVSDCTATESTDEELENYLKEEIQLLC